MPTWMMRAVVCLLAFGSTQSLLSQKTTAVSTETQQHIKDVQASLLPAVVSKDDPHPAHGLSERMVALHVNGVSIAVIHHGVIEWARGFGVTRVGGPPVNAETLFQAGSISKPVAAMAALHQVQIGKLSLDADVNSVLTSWLLPDAAVAGGKPVTLRELLTHTGGTTVHGFEGYAKGEPVPTLVQVLNGEKPANSPAIRTEAAPGARWNYSGGGYTIMQQMLIDETKEPFAKLLHDTVLAPIGMTHSTYEQPLPAAMHPSAATPYEADGKPVPGGAHTYPELAAAGLWSTPTDLARYCIEIQHSLKGEWNHVLSQEMTKQMLTRGIGDFGLGLAIGGSPANPHFGHGGVNEGFESTMSAYEKDGEGAVVMTNAQGGMRLAEEIMRSIAAVYRWPDFKPRVLASVAVDPKILVTYIGTYEVEPGFNMVVTLQNNHLMMQPTGQSSFSMFAGSPTKFFPTAWDGEVEFIKNDRGKISSMVIRQGGRDSKAMKK